MTAVFRSAMNKLKLWVFVTTPILASLSSFILPFRAGENISDFAPCARVYTFFAYLYLSTTFLDENETSFSTHTHTHTHTHIYICICITETWFRFKTSAPEFCGGKVARRQVSLLPPLPSPASVMLAVLHNLFHSSITYSV